MNEIVSLNLCKQVAAVLRTQPRTNPKRGVSAQLLTQMRAKFGDPGLSRDLDPQVAMIPGSLSGRDGGWAVKTGNNGY
jgi:hypothetical protein